MSTQLRKLGIRLQEGYDTEPFSDGVDCVVVGNVLTRGNAAVEALLDSGLPYYSGPEWLFDNVLQDKWVLAVAGTHGKTTASSMLAWILDYAGHSPGFLIGGVPSDFGISARLGESEFFVVEADEYDTAFFDKRAKFVHYRPRTLSITNIEYDHADIYTDLDAILWQFHQLVRTVPNHGLISVNARDENIEQLQLIYHLVKERGFTLKGAKQELGTKRKYYKQKQKVLQTLREVKTFLAELQEKL